jgi:hypothetical protein
MPHSRYDQERRSLCWNCRRGMSFRCSNSRRLLEEIPETAVMPTALAPFVQSPSPADDLQIAKSAGDKP